MLKSTKLFLRTRFPHLLMMFRYLRAWLKGAAPSGTHPLGFKFSGDSNMLDGSFEPGETRIFLEAIQKADVVINVGANTGYYTCIALSNGKRTVAIEPVPSNVNTLLKNLKINHWDDRAEVFPMAVGNSVGVVEIYGGGTSASVIKGWAGETDKERSLVPCTTLDMLFGKRFDSEKCLMMVDIEGAEKMMLDGADIFLNMTPKPIWFIEISIRAHQPDGVEINPHLLETFSALWDRGYVAWTTHNQCRTVDIDEVQKILHGGDDTLFGDTFIFVDREEHGDFSFHLK